mmetsp:Transcript_51054/g.123177  ORF Transcript_51054/g.123177 Transcript_51054/m.123177 type:complete len:226 (-) Transcript_51054:132-809(-)
MKVCYQTEETHGNEKGEDLRSPSRDKNESKSSYNSSAALETNFFRFISSLSNNGSNRFFRLNDSSIRRSSAVAFCELGAVFVVAGTLSVAAAAVRLPRKIDLGLGTGEAVADVFVVVLVLNQCSGYIPSGTWIGCRNAPTINGSDLYTFSMNSIDWRGISVYIYSNRLKMWHSHSILMLSCCLSMSLAVYEMLSSSPWMRSKIIQGSRQDMCSVCSYHEWYCIRS